MKKKGNLLVLITRINDSLENPNREWEGLWHFQPASAVAFINQNRVVEWSEQDATNRRAYFPGMMADSDVMVIRGRKLPKFIFDSIDPDDAEREVFLAVHLGATLTIDEEARNKLRQEIGSASGLSSSAEKWFGKFKAVYSLGGKFSYDRPVDRFAQLVKGAATRTEDFEAQYVSALVNLRNSLRRPYIPEMMQLSRRVENHKHKIINLIKSVEFDLSDAAISPRGSHDNISHLVGNYGGEKLNALIGQIIGIIYGDEGTDDLSSIQRMAQRARQQCNSDPGKLSIFSNWKKIMDLFPKDSALETAPWSDVKKALDSKERQDIQVAAAELNRWCGDLNSAMEDLARTIEKAFSDHGDNAPIAERLDEY